MNQTQCRGIAPLSRSPHSFHIAVMGTGFTTDTPLRIAKYGLSSVISLVDDTFIEQLRKFHSDREGEPYEEIGSREEDARARRITAYLNLVDRLVERQVEALQTAPFEPGSEITRYYELLPDGPLKSRYETMLAAEDLSEKARLETELRALAVPGSIDVNVMTKLDRDVYRDGQKLGAEYRDAMAALRGFAKSTLRSSIVFSASINPRLYGYIAEFADFFPDENGVLKKKITLKVNDFRSAVVQGRFLAKRGLWVSEYRIESSLNCGGHAFATQGHLMGPMLEEFKEGRDKLVGELHETCSGVLAAQGKPSAQTPREVRFTVQGGIGTAAEDRLMREFYLADATGWATPFLLVPEVANVDDEHLKRLAEATEDQVYLGDGSPLSVPFWTLSTTASEETRRQRIREGKPGSPCPKGHAWTNTEFTDRPICLSSRTYQKLKLEQLSRDGDKLTEAQREAIRAHVLGKACICHELSGGAVLKHGLGDNETPAICPGANIAYFSKIASLEEMVSHIYGRISLLSNPDRPHMFIRELMLYVDYLRREVDEVKLGLQSATPKYFGEFKENLLSGIAYYQDLVAQFGEDQRERFLRDLRALHEKVEGIQIQRVPAG